MSLGALQPVLRVNVFVSFEAFLFCCTVNFHILINFCNFTTILLKKLYTTERVNSLCCIGTGVCYYCWKVWNASESVWPHPGLVSQSSLGWHRFEKPWAETDGRKNCEVQGMCNTLCTLPNNTIQCTTVLTIHYVYTTLQYNALPYILQWKTLHYTMIDIWIDKLNILLKKLVKQKQMSGKLFSNIQRYYTHTCADIQETNL